MNNDYLEILNPRGRQAAIEKVRLSSRPSGLDFKRVWLVRSWAAGSGMEPILQTIEAVLKAGYPGVSVEHVAKPTAYSVDDPEFRDAVAANADAFIYAAAYSASTTHYAIHYGAMIEAAGCPGVVLCYDTLKNDAANSVRGACAPVRWISVPYPLDGAGAGTLTEIAHQAVQRLLDELLPAERGAGLVPPPMSPEYIDFRGRSAQDALYEDGYTDGLPVVVPTEERVRRMLGGTSISEDTVVASDVGPEGWTATVKHVAINAVMAGCTPEAFPIVLAAVHAYASGPPGSQSMYATQARATSSFAFMQLVNGPIASLAGMNSGLNALGPGNRGNATVGRALRLSILNLGGGKVGTNLMPVIGNVAAYTFAFPENEAGSPWASLAQSRGFSTGENVLTFFSGGWSHTGNYIEAGLERLAEDVAGFEYPSGLTILMSPARARALASTGWTKESIEEFVWSNATRPLRDLRRTTYWPTLIEPNLRGPESLRRWPSTYLNLRDDDIVQVYPRQLVKVVVVGGDVSPMMQAWKMQIGSSVSIDRWR